MKTRSISAVGIVLVSIVPAILGGWIFAATIVAIFSLAFTEMLRLLRHSDAITRWLGIGVITFAGILAMVWPEGKALPLFLVIVLLSPLPLVIWPPGPEGNSHDWAIRQGAIAYLAFPAYAIVAVRETAGWADREWMQNLAEFMPHSRHTSEGLGWFFLALWITWMSDTFAYLVGKSIGKTKLIPRVSPNKTVEGAIGGVLAGGITAMLIVIACGLPVNALVAFVLGVILSCLGMIGDLFESQLKRRAGVKDSGTAIPGHGGFLDRIDALIWVVLATFALLPFLT